MNPDLLPVLRTGRMKLFREVFFALICATFAQSACTSCGGD